MIFSHSKDMRLINQLYNFDLNTSTKYAFKNKYVNSIVLLYYLIIWTIPGIVYFYFVKKSNGIKKKKTFFNVCIFDLNL